MQADILYNFVYTFVEKMEAINTIPVSLYKNLSDKLISVILDSEDRDAISTVDTKKIIYLWRQDQLASPTGLETLLQAGVKVDQSAVEQILEDLGLQEIAVAVKAL
jgi:hypothetical protein